MDGWQRFVNKLADDVEGLSPRLKETAKLLRDAESESDALDGRRG